MLEEEEGLDNFFNSFFVNSNLTDQSRPLEKNPRILVSSNIGGVLFL